MPSLHFAFLSPPRELRWVSRGELTLSDLLPPKCLSFINDKICMCSWHGSLWSLTVTNYCKCMSVHHTAWTDKRLNPQQGWGVVSLRINFFLVWFTACSSQNIPSLLWFHICTQSILIFWPILARKEYSQKEKTSFSYMDCPGRPVEDLEETRWRGSL